MNKGKDLFFRGPFIKISMFAKKQLEIYKVYEMAETPTFSFRNTRYLTLSRGQSHYMIWPCDITSLIFTHKQYTGSGKEIVGRETSLTCSQLVETYTEEISISFGSG